MPDITLHDIDESTYSAIRAAAEIEDLSLNQVIKRALRKAAREKTLGDPLVHEPATVYGTVPNLALSIDPDLLQRARLLAEARGTTLLGLVSDSLATFVESQPRPPKRTLGTWKGLVRIAPDFDDLPQDIAEAFGMEGGETA